MCKDCSLSSLVYLVRESINKILGLQMNYSSLKKRNNIPGAVTHLRRKGSAVRQNKSGNKCV